MRAALAVLAALALAGPARAFDFAPDGFAEVYNAAAAARGWRERLLFRDCDAAAVPVRCFYSFGTGTRATVAAGPAGRAGTLTFAFDWHARSLPGLRTAPMIVMDILGTAPAERTRLVRDIFNGDMLAYARPRDPVTVDGIGFNAAVTSPGDEVVYWFKDGRP